VNVRVLSPPNIPPSAISIYKKTNIVNGYEEAEKLKYGDHVVIQNVRQYQSLKIGAMTYIETTATNAFNS